MVGEKNNHAELHSDDGEWEFFYAGAAPALQRMRRRLDGGEGGQGQAIAVFFYRLSEIRVCFYFGYCIYML